MRHTFLHKEDGRWTGSEDFTGPASSDLLIFFCGWAADHNTVRLLLENDSLCSGCGSIDILVCHDYAACRNSRAEHVLLSSRTISETTREYRNIFLTAWSLGVWAADNTKEIIDLDQRSALKECIAVNGTLCPANDRYGIPVSIFKGTLDSMDERNLYKFRRRMCGSRECYEKFMEFAPERSLDSDIRELDYIFNACGSVDICKNHLKWTKAVIGNSDMIFPPENQSAAWKEYAKQNSTLSIKETDSPHFGIDLFRQ